MDDVDQASLVETLDREAAIRRVVQRRRHIQQFKDGQVTCPDCGEIIPAERLAAVPDAVRCFECQRDLEG